MDGVEGGGRSGRAAMGRPGTRRHFDQFSRRLRGALAAAIHRASLVRLLPSALGWDVLAPGGVAADTAPVLPAQSLREHGASGSPGSGGASWGLNLHRSSFSLPDLTPRPHLVVYIYMYVFL